MWALLSAIGTWIVGFGGTMLADNVARWIALKVLVTAIFVTILPVVLNNVFYALINSIFAVGTSQMGSAAAAVNSGQPVVLQLSGMVAWVAIHCNIVSAISVWISVLSVKYTLGLIPFVRL